MEYKYNCKVHPRVLRTINDNLKFEEYMNLTSKYEEIRLKYNRKNPQISITGVDYFGNEEEIKSCDINIKQLDEILKCYKIKK